MNTSRYPVEYPGSFVLGGKKIFRSGEGGGETGERKEKKGYTPSKKKKQIFTIGN